MFVKGPWQLKPYATMSEALILVCAYVCVGREGVVDKFSTQRGM